MSINRFGQDDARYPALRVRFLSVRYFVPAEYAKVPSGCLLQINVGHTLQRSRCTPFVLLRFGVDKVNTQAGIPPTFFFVCRDVQYQRQRVPPQNV